MKTYIAVLLGSVLWAILLTPVVIWVARRVGAHDEPGVRKVHTKAIPRIGGIAVFIPTLILTSAVLWLDNAVSRAFREIEWQIIALAVGATAAFGVGLADDLYQLRARTKFIVQVAAAVLVCAFGIRINAFAVGDWMRIEFGLFSWPLTILWLVGICNAVNLIDGLDGLAAGIASIACAVIAMLAIHTGMAVMAVLMLALLGSLLGFLVFNFNPAKVFLGDSGSLFLGFVLGASSVMCSQKSVTMVGLALPFLALGVPILDTLFSMLRRTLERRSMFAPDRSHIHHRLVDLGLHQRHVVLFIYLVTATTTGLGLVMMITRGRETVVVFCCVMLLLLVVFRMVGAIRLRETIERIRVNQRLARDNKETRRVHDRACLTVRAAGDFEQWWQAMCAAGKEMDFVWLSASYQDDAGVEQIIVWRNPSWVPDSGRVLDVRLPAPPWSDVPSLDLQLGVAINGSLETASHRATQFARLVDEYRPVTRPREGGVSASDRSVGRDALWTPSRSGPVA
ncbi:MAG: hypothetical protein CME06_02450 [Gemmatimonadetes bacterium]|nr:hypothetical protein [Gemmatimonadota bacterium]